MGDAQEEMIQNSMRESFEAVDTDHNGRISFIQMGQVLHQMTRNQPVPNSIIQDIISKSDADNSGYITLDEFKAAVMGMTNIVFIIIVSDAEKRFERYDVDKDGKLNRVELEAFIESVPEHRKPINVQNIIDTCDLNKDGVIDFDEFIRCLLDNQ